MRRDKLIKEYTTRGGTHVTIFQEMNQDDQQVYIANEDADKERKVVFTEGCIIPPAKPIIVRPDLVGEDKKIFTLWEGIKKDREMIVKMATGSDENFAAVLKSHTNLAIIVYILVTIQACPWVWPYLIMLKDVVKSYM